MVARTLHAARGLLVGAMAGAVAGLADQFVRSVDPGLAVSPTAALAVLLYWVVVFAPIGLVVGAAFGRAVRWADAVLAAAAFVVFVGGYVNLRWLPGVLDPASLFFDAALIALSAAVVVLAARSPYRFDIRARISALILVGLVVGMGLASSRAHRMPEELPAGAGSSGPDVLVVLLDALRADHCSAYGYPRETTPELDRLAASGARFERAYSVSSWTKPAVATLFSGMYPARHGNHAINSLLPGEIATLPELFSAAGWRTAVFAENNFVSPLFGFDQGVDHFEGSDPPVYTQTVLGHVLEQVAVRWTALQPLVRRARFVDRFDPAQRRFSEDGIDLPERVSGWVDGLPEGQGFFAYVHLLKPHAPYVVPDEFEGLWSGPGSANHVRPPHVDGIGPFAQAQGLDDEARAHLVDNYDERIRFGDHQLGRIVDGVRASGRNPLVVVLSDHGEEFGENGLYDHGHSLQEGVVRIPLVMSWPGRIPAGIEVGGIARMLDLPPTLLRWSGLAVPDAFDGESIARAPTELGADSGSGAAPVLLELQHGPGYGAHALVRDPLKLVRTEQGGRHLEEVFDLAADPRESDSIAVSDEDPLVWMQTELDTLLAWLRGRGSVSAETGIDPATAERLRALGYIR